MSIFCPSALCNESGSVTTPGASHVLDASGPFPHSWDTWGRREGGGSTGVDVSDGQSTYHVAPRCVALVNGLTALIQLRPITVSAADTELQHREGQQVTRLWFSAEV